MLRYDPFVFPLGVEASRLYFLWDPKGVRIFSLQIIPYRTARRVVADRIYIKMLTSGVRQFILNRAIELWVTTTEGWLCSLFMVL